MGVFFTTVGSDDKAGNVDAGRLEVCRKVREQIIPQFAGGDTIIADKRESDDKDLAAVGGVRHRLGIANHPGLEDELASNALVSTEAIP